MLAAISTYPASHFRDIRPASQQRRNASQKFPAPTIPIHQKNTQIADMYHCFQTLSKQAPPALAATTTTPLGTTPLQNACCIYAAKETSKPPRDLPIGVGDWRDRAVRVL
jgi:hypothetical protein